MIAGMALRGAGLLAGAVSPKTIMSLAKYMYIKRVLDHYGISVILDVGANRGQFAISMRRVGFRGSIFSFEPVTSEFQRLLSAAEGDRSWKTFRFALGEVDCDQEINVMTSSVFSSFNQPSVAETSDFVEGNTVVRTELVKIRRLAAVIQDLDLEQTLNQTFVKCDTQGFDMPALKGCGSLLKEVRMIQVELGITQIYQGTPGYTEMLQYVEKEGFAPVSMFPINRMPDWSAAEMDLLAVNRSFCSQSKSLRSP